MLVFSVSQDVWKFHLSKVFQIVSFIDAWFVGHVSDLELGIDAILIAFMEWKFEPGKRELLLVAVLHVYVILAMFTGQLLSFLVN
jgi:hypothetical protein